MTINKVYEQLTKRFPDSLISVRVNYSPGVPGKVGPFYYAIAYVDNSPTSPSPPSESFTDPEDALKKLLFYVSLP